MKYYLAQTYIEAVFNGHEYNDAGDYIESTTKAASNKRLIGSDILTFDRDLTVFLFDSEKALLNKYDVTANQKVIKGNAVYFAVQMPITTNTVNYINYTVYYISYPHYKTFTITENLDDEKQIFRKSISDKINFMNEDFNRLKSMGIDDKFFFEVEKNNKTILKAEIIKSNIVFDYNYNVAEVSLNVTDEYSDFDENAKEEFQLTQLGLKTDIINTPVNCVLQTYIKGADVMESYQDGISTEVGVDFDTNIDADLTPIGFKVALHYYEMEVKRTSHGIRLGKFFKGTQDRMGDGQGNIFRAYDYYEGRCHYSIGNYKTRERVPVNLRGQLIGLYDENNFGLEANISIGFYAEKIICQRLLTVAERIGTMKISPWGNFKFAVKDFKSNVIYCTQISYEDEGIGQDENGNYLLPYPGGYPITQSNWSYSSLWYIVDDTVQIYINAFRGSIAITDFYNLGDVITTLCKKIGIKHEKTAEYSQFLYGDNPVETFDMYITPKSNVIKAFKTQAAIKSNISLSNILEMLRNVLRAYYYIEDGKLKIEHILFFLNGKSYNTRYDVQLNLSSVKDIFNKKTLNFLQNKVSYNKVDIARKYTMTWMDDTTELFGGQNAIITSNFVEKDSEKTINISNFMTDISYIVSQPESISSDGFVLAATEKGVYTVKEKEIEYNEQIKRISNGMLAWRYIFDTFYSYDLPAEYYQWEKGGGGIARSIKKSMKQEIEFVGDIDIDPYRLVLTDIGAGVITSIERNINSNKIKLTLIFEPK